MTEKNKFKTHSSRIVLVVIIAFVGILSGLVYKSTYDYFYKSESSDWTQCGLPVDYKFVSNTPFIIFVHRDISLSKPKGKSDMVLPTCEEEKIYCFNNSDSEILNPIDGTVRNNIKPNLIFMTNISEDDSLASADGFTVQKRSSIKIC